MIRLRPRDLCALLRVPFTAEQLKAATAPMEPAVIVAGAGSGKTSVMAARVVWLVVTGQVKPTGVLGLTFTNKAAAELSARIRGALDAAGVRRSTSQLPLAAQEASVSGEDWGSGDWGSMEDWGSGEGGEPSVATYHSFAGRLLTEHGLRVGVEPRARLMTEAQRYQLAVRVLRRHRGRIEALASSVDTVAGYLVDLEAELSEHLVPAARLRELDQSWLAAIGAERAAQERSSRPRGLRDLGTLSTTVCKRLELVRLVEEYRTAKRDLDLVDFGDQVAIGAQLAECCPQVGVVERANAGVVLLDEYQDTSVAQRRMLAGLFGGGHPVTAVGDPCQAVYGWRGASVANLDDFPAHFRRGDGRRARVYELSVNQRSGGRLLRLANTVADALRERHRVVELKAPPAVADRGDTEVALHNSWAGEARWLAGRLRAIVDAGTSPGECAVLVRARGDIPTLHAALLETRLPVEVVGLGGLLALPEIADVVATLRVLHDPAANAPLIRLLTGPRWRIGARDLAALGRRATLLLDDDARDAAAGDRSVRDRSADGRSAGDRSAGDRSADGRSACDRDPLVDAVAGVDPAEVVSLSDALAHPGPEASEEARARLSLLAGELTRLRRHVAEPLLDLVHRVVETIGLDVELAASPEAVAARRRDSLSAFVDVAGQFAGLDGDAGLPAFLAYLAAAERYERGLDIATPSGSNAVQLLTVHKAKGLEWDVVAVPNLSRSVFPAATGRGRWPTTADVLPTPLRGDTAALPVCGGPGSRELAQYKLDCKAHEEREERRLAYVAVTRARSALLASGHWWGPTQKRLRGPSPFLEQLRESCLAGNGTVVHWAPAPASGANPGLGVDNEVAWPAPAHEGARLRCQEAAALVHAAMDARRSGIAGDGRHAAASADPPDDLASMTASERALLTDLDRDTDLLLAELARDRRDVVEVPLPTTLTATQVMKLGADPGGLARDLARPMPRRPAPATARGTRFHAWVETLFRQRPLLDPDDLPGAEDEDLTSDADLGALKEAFLTGPYGNRVPHAVEAAFSIVLGDRVVEGRIDGVYDLRHGRWEVVDWKTGTEPADPLQLSVYRLAWAQLAGVTPADVEAAFLYVRQRRVERPALLGADELLCLLTEGALTVRGSPAREAV